MTWPLTPSRGAKRTITSWLLPKCCTTASGKSAAVNVARKTVKLAGLSKPTSIKVPPVKSNPQFNHLVLNDPSEITTNNIDNQVAGFENFMKLMVCFDLINSNIVDPA